MYNFSLRRKWISKIVAVRVDEAAVLCEDFRNGFRVKADSRTTRLLSSGLSLRLVTRANSPSQCEERVDVQGVCRSRIKCLGYLMKFIVLWTKVLIELP